MLVYGTFRILSIIFSEKCYRVHILKIVLIVGAYVAKIILKLCSGFAIWYHVLPYQLYVYDIS